MYTFHKIKFIKPQFTVYHSFNGIRRSADDLLESLYRNVRRSYLNEAYALEIEAADSSETFVTLD
jgi:hypothetical protein